MRCAPGVPCRPRLHIAILAGFSLAVWGCGEDAPKGPQLNPEVAKRLSELGDSSFQTRWIAADKLGDLGDAVAVEPLIKTLKNDANGRVRQYAAKALGKLGDSRATEPLLDALRQALEQKDSLLASPVIEALGQIRDKRAVEPLAQVLVNPKLPAYASPVAIVLGRIGHVGAVQPLLKQLQLKAANRFFARQVADMAEALGKIGDKTAVEPLSRLVRHEKPVVRKQVGVALARLGDKRGIPGLIEALADWRTGPVAAGLLEEFGWRPESDTDRVRRLVAKRQAKELLAIWPTARKVLLLDAGRADREIAANAARALVQLGQKDVIPDLIAVMEKSKSEAIALVCLNCGRKELEGAAAAWLRKHGYKVTSLRTLSTGAGPDQEWGRLGGR